MEKYVVEELVKERILKNNKSLFSENEIKMLEENILCISKVYTLGLIDNLNI